MKRILILLAALLSAYPVNAQIVRGDQFVFGATGAVTSKVRVLTGSGSPESAVTAPVGTVYLQTNSGSTVVAAWTKQSGSGNTGWGRIAATTDTLAQFASTTSAQLAGVLSNETGTGAAVFADSPALTTSPTAPTQSSSDSSTKIATTSFVATAVSNAVAAVNPAVAVRLATATVLPNSPTYNNGVSGVGAFLTTATTNTALVVDGVTVALNDRVLVKNQAAGLQNGVYTLSTAPSLGVAWILTRALDYNQPSDMNNTGAIPVYLGTANTDTSWVLTSAVTTVGTDALTFTQFSLNPTTLVVGPASVTDLHIAQFDGTSGKLLKDGGALGTLAAQSGTFSGTSSGTNTGDQTITLTGEVTGTGTGSFTASLGSFTSASLATALTNETGSGAAVFGTAPTITLANGSGLPISTGVSGLGTGVATFLATPSSANFATALTDELSAGSSPKALFGDQAVATTSSPTFALVTANGYRETYAAKTSNFTAAATDSFFTCDATSGAVTGTLPAASSAAAGRTYTMKKIDSSANACIWDGNASETIDGATTFSITVQYNSITVITDGSSVWFIK